MKTFVMGDIHGAHKALVQCLERSGFDKENDTLIQLGDIADGFDEVYECVEELLTIPHLIHLRGNHDDEFVHWMEYGMHRWNWLQGARATVDSYIRHADRDVRITPKMGGYLTNITTYDVPETHRTFFRTQHYKYIDNNKCFVHGGFDRHYPINEQSNHILFWDRDLWLEALSYKQMPTPINKDGKFKIKDNFDEIFIGHTATVNWDTTEPMHAANVWNLDTGAGFAGKLTIMDVDTKEYFQSDNVRELYPDQKGR